MSDNLIDDLAEGKRPAGDQVIAQPQQKDSHIQYTSVELPSKGLLGYPAVVEYRDIMVKDEKAIANATEKTFFKTLNSVLRGLLKDDSFFDQLALGDRDFLLLYIWANSYDTEKKVKHQCTSCGNVNEYIVDVSELEVEELNSKYKKNYVHKFKSGKKYGLRLLTVRDEEIASEYALKHSYNDLVDETYVMMSLSINNNMAGSIEDKIRWVEENISGRDMAEVRAFHEFFKFGVGDSVKRACNRCKEVNDVVIPFQYDFFIPTAEIDFEHSI